MRKIFILSLFTTISLFASAQKGVVKDATRAFKSDDLNEARALVKQALQHDETANDPETWKLAGDIGDKTFDNERIKEGLGQNANHQVMYNGLMESYEPYLKADSLAQIPDSKGRVKNNVRKDIADKLFANQHFFINGGIFFNEKKEYSKASKYFETFWDIPQLDVVEDIRNNFPIDSTYQTIKYYAIITAIQAEDNKKALELLERATNEPFIENSAYEESDLYELLATQYQQSGDTASYMEILTVGSAKYPKSKYFIPNLINIYIQNGENEKALEYLDQAIANDSTNACDLNSVKAALFVEQGEFDKAEVEFKKALEADENCNRALEGLALNYILQAQELKDKSAQEMNDRKLQAKYDEQTIVFYQLSLPHLEKYTENITADGANEQAIKSALIKLQNVYYNLSNLGIDKSKELDLVEEQLSAYE